MWASLWSPGNDFFLDGIALLTVLGLQVIEQIVFSIWSYYILITSQEMSELYKMRNFTSSYFTTQPVCRELWKGPHLHWFAVVINCGLVLMGWCGTGFLHAGLEGQSPHPPAWSRPRCSVLCCDLSLKVSGWNTTYLWLANTSNHHGWTNIALGPSHILRHPFFLLPPPLSFPSLSPS